MFVSPELVQLSEWKDMLSGSAMKSKLSMVAIDEANGWLLCSDIIVLAGATD